tara:strand:- start:526 stop:699 length:174 start_codon:yes stop_codon:yes gene_type:complete
MEPMTFKQKLLMEAVNEFANGHTEIETEAFEDGLWAMEQINQKLLSELKTQETISKW